MMINVNIDKAKEIAHTQRRAVREELFKGLDIQATIPMYAEKAEIKRQEIRDKFALIQTSIDESTDVEQLKDALALCANA